MIRKAISTILLFALLFSSTIAIVRAETYKVGTINVVPQTLDPVESGKPKTYTVTVNRGTDQGSVTGKFDATVTIYWANTTLPPETAFSSEPVRFTSKDMSKQVTISITVPTLTPAGEYSFTVKVTRNDAPYDYRYGDGKLTVANHAPTLTYPTSDPTIKEEELYTFTAKATDLDLNSNPPQTLTFTLEGITNGASITTSGDFTWTPTEYQGPGKYDFTIRVTDNGTPNMYNEKKITVTVDEVNLPPVLSLPDLPGEIEETASTWTFTATATDPDYPPNTLTFSLADGQTGTVPVGASINSATGVFTWTPTEAQGPGDYTFDVVVSDGYLIDSKTINVHVNEVNYANVNVGDTGPIYVNEGAQLEFTGPITLSGIATADIYPILEGFPPLSGLIGQYYAIGVTATFGGSVIVSIPYDATGLTLEQELSLNLATSDGQPLTGDFNGDGVVDVKDQTLLTIAMNNNGPGGQVRYDEIYDLVFDGSLDSADLQEFKLHLGETSWVDITIYVDTVNNIIYGETWHFSGFGVHR